jgi:hypothetical protein
MMAEPNEPEVTAMPTATVTTMRMIVAMTGLKALLLRPKSSVLLEN